MGNLDIGLTVINVVLAILSGVGAGKSLKYYKKSKNLTVFAKTNKVLIEVQKMLTKLPEALSAASKSQNKQKGFNLKYKLCSIGQDLNGSLIEINSNIPTEYTNAIRNLQSKGGFDLQTYINSYISGEAIKENSIDFDKYNLCQKRLDEIQDYLKKIADEIEEKLK